MPDLETALEELRRASERPPAPPAPLESITGRSRRRRATRRALVAMASIAVLLGTTALIIYTTADEQVSELRTAGEADHDDAPPSTTETISGESGTGSVPPVDVTPEQGLIDGQVVVVEGDFGGDAIVAMCGSEVVETGDPSSAATTWCDMTLTWRSLSPGRGQVEVRRALDTMGGRVDCAERPGRCVVGVRDGMRDLAAPVAFRADLPPLDEPTITVPGGPFSDGELVAVEAQGMWPGDVQVTQCTTDPTSGGMDRCDQARPTRAAARSDGRLATTVPVFAEILTADGWVVCDPCVLRAGNAMAEIEVVSPIDGASRPEVTIDPAGPYAPGQRVIVRGSGFAPNERTIQISWCAFSTPTPEREVQGDPAYGHAPCGYPLDDSVVADSSGSFTVEDFPLPDRPFGWTQAGDCADLAQRCGLAWHRYEGSLPVFVTLFEIAG